MNPQGPGNNGHEGDQNRAASDASSESVNGPPEVINISDDEEDPRQCLSWYIQDPVGSFQGPYSLYTLRRWWNSGLVPEKLVVWLDVHDGEMWEGYRLSLILHLFFELPD